MTDFIILFFITFSAALLGVVPPGLINITAAKISTQKGKMNGIIFAIGASIVVFIQAIIAVMISKYLYHNQQIIEVLEKAAVVIFGLLAIYFFIVARKKTKKKKRIRMVKVSKKGSFFKGIFLAMLNVLPIPYFIGLNALWRASDLMEFTVVDIITFVLGTGFGTFAMLYMYVFYFNKSQSKSGNFSKYSDHILSGLMLVLVIVTLIRIFYKPDVV
ncbi:threonine/homoserine/homoserine lactone efflux protein [Kordia periserrulae]|uniref:Threonine/homoserine/homoserine lactone efflux protein n=1 Tax=Kordia periserrulae TaxID=701523 RepID=A0A2T6BT64_9FLAO|nr:lysine transporter LysE [Kordia periserrulae]PTX59263.1 threonine/homoserine/homoserine lactone efflux protein [Kordia periserrulae]